ncbi:hypothetical protein [Zunongwangia sp. HRR-M8]|uniref:hypothetical protein n=1 Tax=Zunongwangia sp. HRR-M8 TaxID=3015170 RepID=UPI0022DDF1A0|nr:hypothetical protein [Zunongwangia sp. HRR-M8]WBL21171.1 hypothetical protein PBT89_10540 [Zunongwangia sp. HRR-M8]
MSNTENTGGKSPKEMEEIKGAVNDTSAKIYPIIKPADWVGIRAGALKTNMIGSPAENNLKLVVAYGKDTPDNLVFLTQNDLPKYEGRNIIEEALQNIDEYPTEFEYFEAFENRALSASGPDFASERILSQSHMLKAHEMLEAEELIVSIPRRSCMMVIARDASEDLLNKFAYLHDYTWNDDSYGNAPISNLLFIVKEGSIVAHINLED